MALCRVRFRAILVTQRNGAYPSPKLEKPCDLQTIGNENIKLSTSFWAGSEVALTRAQLAGVRDFNY